MPGTKGKSGRKKKAGQYYRFGVRFDPLRHPPEFESFLISLNRSAPANRAALLLDVFLNGQRDEEPDQIGEETFEDASALEDMFSDF